VENSLRAGATRVLISIDEDTKGNLLTLTIADNGQGMDEATVARVLDPFYTTKGGKRTGLGLPMLAQACREGGGSLTVRSAVGKGTTVTASFMRDHIDRKPMGDIAETLCGLIATNGADVEFRYRHRKDAREFVIDTGEVREVLGDVSITDTRVTDWLRQEIVRGLRRIHC
jgi:hypothetical protein